MDLDKYTGIPAPDAADQQAGERLYSAQHTVSPKERHALLDRYDELISSLEMSSVLKLAAELVATDCRAERATVYLIEKETHELESVAVIGNVARTIRVPIDRSSLSGYCALTGRAFVIPDAYGDLSALDPDLKFDSAWDELNGFRTKDVLCAPLRFKDRILGVTQAMNGLDRPLSEEDLVELEGNGRLIAYALYHASLLRDITALKKLEREKADFMRVLVHELKSPVSASSMLISVLETCHDDADRIDDMTGRIKNRLDQMMVLIQDILELATVKSGDPLGEIEVVDLAAEARAACDSYREQAAAKELGFRVAIPEAALPVRFDVKGLRLVLSNLLSNAVKYTESGYVAVTVRASGPWAEIGIKDTGIGVPQKDIALLFTEFHRASNARRKKIPGSGVGLASVKKMVERFGGHLELASKENEGSSFTVRLPLKDHSPS